MSSRQNNPLPGRLIRVTQLTKIKTRHSHSFITYSTWKARHMLVPCQVLGLQQQTGGQVVVETESKQAGSKQGDCRVAGATKTGPMTERRRRCCGWMRESLYRRNEI